MEFEKIINSGNLYPDLSRGFNEGEFTGKVVFVTGGSRGIGRATARHFAELGANVAINSRLGSQDQALGVVEELREMGTQADWFPGDIAASATAKKLIDGVVGKFGRLDILVNNAGTREDGLFVRMSDEQMMRVMETNFFGPVRVTREAIKQMMKQRPRGGSIVFTSSLAAEGSPGQANYAASKGALISLAKTLALEYQSAGIRVNCIAPGLVETDLTAGLSQIQVEAILNATNSQRGLKPEEVAEEIVFLSSSNANPINGQLIPILGPAVNR